jgi:hypothetical protein
MSSSVQTIDLSNVPNCVIGGSAFAFCHNLTSIYIPEGTVTLISGNGMQSGTFESCTNLTSVTFGSSNIYIGTRSFYDCSSLSINTIPAFSIEYQAF